MANHLKGLGHEIYQNSNNANRYQIERHIKIPAQKVKRSGYKHSKYQRRHRWKNLRKIQTDCNCGS